MLDARQHAAKTLADLYEIKSLFQSMHWDDCLDRLEYEFKDLRDAIDILIRRLEQL